MVLVDHPLFAARDPTSRYWSKSAEGAKNAREAEPYGGVGVGVAGGVGVGVGVGVGAAAKHSSGALALIAFQTPLAGSSFFTVAPVAADDSMQ